MSNESDKYRHLYHFCTNQLKRMHRKHMLLSEPFDRKSVKRKKTEDQPEDLFEGLRDDPQFKEFLSVQRSFKAGKKDKKKKKPVYGWANDLETIDDEEDDQQDVPVVEEPVKQSDQKEAKNKKEFVQSEWTVKVRELPCKIKKGDVKRFFAPAAVTRVKLPGRIKGIAYVSFKSQKDFEKGLQKHKSMLNGHQVLVSHLKQKGSVTLASRSEPKPYHQITESVADTGRLYVRNLCYTCTSQDLEDLFSPFGQLTEVYLPIDPSTKKVKGFAFVTFVFPEHAITAMDALDKTKFQGRLIHILPGESKPEQYSHFNNLSIFKQKKEADLKDARKNASTWNTLFLGANAVADAMSGKLNVKKSDLIADVNTKDSIAVRMALGETQIVNETKQLLLEHGVNLDAFTEQTVAEGLNPNDVIVKRRSKTVILVKNLSYGTEASEIENLFGRFGIVKRVILPQHAVTAIVEMQEEVEAKKAFNSLISYKLRHVPIYLEWAPVDVFVRKIVSAGDAEDVSTG